MTLMLRYAARSDVGLIREMNQDSVYAGPRLLAVADGMGGHAAGDVASRVVVSILSGLDEDAVGGDLVDSLRKATFQANEHLRAMVQGDSELDGMGTTLTAMLYSGNRFGLVHIGDSRAYLMRAGELSQITHDDTFVQSLVDEGRITADEATTHPQRSVLLRVLTGADVEPYFSVREAVAGDRYLICSDGLSGVVSDETIAEALEIDDPQDAADRLVELALRAGAPDNVTCVVADVVDATLVPDEPVIGGAVAEGQLERGPSPDSAAGRAALARPVQPKPAAGPPEEPPNRRRGRWLVAGLVALALIGAIAWAGWQYVQAQYFVGATADGRVEIYRGVIGGVAGIQLHRKSRSTDLRLDDLEPAARVSVRNGITATSLGNAGQIVNRLRHQQLPTCPKPLLAPSPTPKVTPAPKADQPPKTHVAPTPSISPTPTHSPIPGQDCRAPRS